MLLNSVNRDMFKPFRSHSGLLDYVLVACLRIGTCFREHSFRETHLWDHFGGRDKIALITCVENLNASEILLPSKYHSFGSRCRDKTMTAKDLTESRFFRRPEITFWGHFLTKLHRSFKRSSGDGGPKLQISVPCRGWISTFRGYLLKTLHRNLKMHWR